MPYVDLQKQRAYQLAWALRRRREWVEANGPCVQCGSSADLEVDHVDPAQKVSHRVWTWAATRRLAELAKCQVLCGECHKQKTIAFNTIRMPHGVTAYRRGCRCSECRESQRVRVARQRTQRTA